MTYDRSRQVLFAVALGAVFLVAGLPRIPAGEEEPAVDGKLLGDWIKAFEKGTPKEREKALAAFTTLGPKAKAAIPTLVSALQDTDRGGQAALALAIIGAESVPGLMATLTAKDANQQTRTNAQLGLTALGAKAKAAIPDLIQSLEKEEVAPAASLVLGAIGGEAVPALLTAADSGKLLVRRYAFFALALMGPKAEAAIPTLLKSVRDQDAKISEMAQVALKNMVVPSDKGAGKPGPEHVKATHAILIALVNNNDPLVNYRVVILLVALKEPAVGGIAEGLKDPDIKVVGTSLVILAKMGKAALAPIVEAVKSGGPKVRQFAILALKDMGEPALPCLIAVLQDRDKVGRLFALNVLGHLGPKAREAVPHVVKILQQGENAFQWHAAYTLGQIGPQAKAALPALEGTLDDPDALVRVAAALAVWQIAADAKVIPLLMSTCQKADKFAPTAALAALGRIGPAAKAAMPILADFVKDKKNAMQQALAAAALGRIGSEEAVDHLIDALNVKPGDWRTAAVALGRIGPRAKKAVPHLLLIVQDKTYRGIRPAFLVVAKMKDDLNQQVKLLIPWIGDLLDDDQFGDAPVAAAWSLWQIAKHPLALPALIEELKDNQPAIRRAAAYALGLIGTEAKDVVPALIPLLNDTDLPVRNAAAEAIRKVEPQAAVRLGLL